MVYPVFLPRFSNFLVLENFYKKINQKISYYFTLAIMFQSVLNYVPPVPLCPTRLRCLHVSRAACLTCLRAFVSLPCECLHFLRALRTFIFYELYVAYAPLVFTSLICLTCPIFYVPYVSSFLYLPSFCYMP